MRYGTTLCVIVTALCFFAVGALATVPSYINFQGTLTDSGGDPITGARSMQFSLYDDSLSSTQLWDEPHSSVDIQDGLFRVQLGSVISLPPSLFDGSVLWLGILVGSDPQEMTPRFPIVTAPYSFRSNTADEALEADLAYHAIHADTADYAHQAGIAAISVHAVYSDTANHAHQAGIAGDAIHSIYSDTAGVAFEAGAAGWANDALHSFYSDTANYAHSAVPDDDWATSGSNIYRMDGYVGIGTTTPAYKLHVEGQAISGTNSNASGLYSTISGGYGNTASNNASTVSGGEQCSSSGYWSTVGGGSGNRASYYYATVAGGEFNEASGENAFIGGGELNVASGTMSVVAGGYRNEASGVYSYVGGGIYNQASAASATVAGGGQGQPTMANIASNTGATVSGGQSNHASGLYATISGGNSNGASGGDAVVGGGCINYATGRRATIPGGYGNEAIGNYSFAAGQQAKAYHDGAFVWADSSNADFTSTNINQFLIRASGGVGIGTAAPTHQLTVKSSTTNTLQLIGPYAFGYGSKINFGDGDLVYLQEDTDDKLTIYATDRIALNGGNVGIGINTPAYRLDVSGDVQCVNLHQTSDQRFKTNIRTIDHALKKVSQLRGVSFEWNQEAELVGATPGDHQIGLVAQEVETVLPEIVSTPENGHKSVDYTKLTAVLIEAVKELHSENTELKNHIDNLRGEIAELRKR